MSLWKRIKNIMAKSKTPEPNKTSLFQNQSVEQTATDICEISLVSYEVIGRTDWGRRNLAWLTLRDGSQIKYLFIEQREQTYYSLYHAINGRLDNVEEVPTEIELDGKWYYMENQYDGRVACTGQTPFAVSGERSVWQYQADDCKLLRIEWQDGQFQFYEGDSLITADVRMLRGT